MTKRTNKPDQTIAQAITRAMNGGAPLTAAEKARLTPAELKGANAIIAQNNKAIKAGKASPVTDPKLTGVKTPAQQAKALKNAKGPKQGSAMANQSVKLSKEQPAPKASPDKITSVKATTTGPDYIIVQAGNKTINVPRNQMTGQLNKLATVGASLKALEAYIAEHKPDAKLARGITGRDAPHASKAIGDQRAAPAPKAAAAPKAEKKPAAKRGAVGGDFSYTVGKTADRAEGSWTQHMLVMMQKATDTKAARAAHAKSGKFTDKKLHFSWARDKGYIKY